MTAEIAIVNRESVALAADSAGTVDSKTRRNIHKSVNKLFMLSKYEPVGIMIYQGLDFLRTYPWEMVIKLYRKKRLGRRKLDSLPKYFDDFVTFIENNFLVSEDDQKSFFRRFVNSKFSGINDDLKDPNFTFNLIDELMKKNLKEFVEADAEGRKKLFSEFYISRVCNNLRRYVHNQWNGISSEHFNLIRGNYGNIVDEAIKQIFDDTLLTDKSKKYLQNIGIYTAFEYTTGVVIAGFGRKNSSHQYVHIQLVGFMQIN